MNALKKQIKELTFQNKLSIFRLEKSEKREDILIKRAGVIASNRVVRK